MQNSALVFIMKISTIFLPLKIPPPPKVHFVAFLSATVKGTNFVPA